MNRISHGGPADAETGNRAHVIVVAATSTVSAEQVAETRQGEPGAGGAPAAIRLAATRTAPGPGGATTAIDPSPRRHRRATTCRDDPGSTGNHPPANWNDGEGGAFGGTTRVAIRYSLRPTSSPSTASGQRFFPASS